MARIILSIFFSILFTCSFIKLVSAESQYSRTLYDGYVGIEPVSIDEIELRLEKFGCHVKFEEKAATQCLYHRFVHGAENAIEIYPHGPGFGPLSFYLTKDRLVATKDIPGKPQLESFQKEVRQDLKDVGNIVKIKENTWTLVKTTYPWDVLY